MAIILCLVIFALCSYSLQVTQWRMEPTSLLTNEATFLKKETTACGPQRLGEHWTDASMIACGSSCLKKFQSQCLSFMYNLETHLCTPGFRLSPMYDPPSDAEGELYVIDSCDLYEGFSPRSYGSTTVNLATYPLKLNYSQAIGACASLDAALFAPKTTEKFRIVQQLVIAYQVDAWIGLDDLATEGRFLWLDDKTEIDPGFKAMTYQGDQPDNYLDREDCMEMHYTNQLLNDEGCNETFIFFCEKPSCLNSFTIPS